MIHDVANIQTECTDSPDVVLIIECTCGEVYRFTKEFHPEWNMWSKGYYVDAIDEAYSVLCPREDPMEKRAVVLTEEEKVAHEKAKKDAKSVSYAQKRRRDRFEKEKVEKSKGDSNAKR